MIAGISGQFSNFAFVLFCYITNHLMTGPLGNSEFCFPRDQSLSVNYFLLAQRSENKVFRSENVTKINWGELINNAFVHSICLLLHPSN